MLIIAARGQKGALYYIKAVLESHHYEDNTVYYKFVGACSTTVFVFQANDGIQCSSYHSRYLLPSSCIIKASHDLGKPLMSSHFYLAAILIDCGMRSNLVPPVDLTFSESMSTVDDKICL